MTEQVINSYNIWVDTDAANQAGQQKGDVFNIALGSQSLTADTGQYIRLTLNNFFMYKVWTNVNANNDKFHMIIPGITAPPAGAINYDPNDTAVRVPNKNYRTIYDLAFNFGNAIAQEMESWETGGPTFTVNVVNPPITATVPGTSDDIIEIELTQTGTYSGALAGLSTFVIQCWEEEGESYALLGGDRLQEDDAVPITTGGLTVPFSIKVTNDGGGSPGTGTVWKIQGLYPAQRSTMPYVYLRSRLSNFSIETSSLSQPTEPLNPPKSDVATSQIIGKIPVDTEVCVYDSNYGGDYFLNIYNRHINSVYLYLTDEHNRPLGRVFGSNSLTATGTGTKQSTLGNLQFSAVFRVDIVQQTLPKERLFAPIPNPLDPKTSGQFYDPSRPPNGEDTPDPAMRGLTLMEHAKRNYPVRKAGGIIGRG